jgi:hypothetical protein
MIFIKARVNGGEEEGEKSVKVIISYVSAQPATFWKTVMLALP